VVRVIPDRKAGNTLKSRDLALEAARSALKKKAADTVVLDLGGLTIIADFFVICTGESTTQVKAIAEYIEHEFAEEGIKALSIEGLDYSHWVLIDFGDVIVHVFERETREYYGLEKLWMDAKTVEVDEDKPDLGRKNKRTVYP
jgi:ribosome-associated protein